MPLMRAEEKELKNILQFLNDQRGFNFNGYRIPMLQRRLQKRLFATKSNSLKNYYEFLRENPTEMDNLIDVLTINVSHFFRNPMTFEFLSNILLPELILSKKKDKNLRVWSAGCSFGEEPYSISMILKEYLEKDNSSIKPYIIATDLDKKTLKNARKACYNSTKIEEVKYATLKKYFNKEGENYCVRDEIKEMVQFSFFDLIDQKSLVPPDSIFGNFDIVMCRNVLIYFDIAHQKIIFNKLYKSLKLNGILVLGEAETIDGSHKHKFERINECCKIYRKIG